MKNSIIPAIALFAFVIPGLAAAQVPAGKSAPAVTVRYNDLDLRDPQGAKVMLHRIRKAAVDICQSGETGFDATERFETCYHRTVGQAAAKLNAPHVTAALDARAHGPVLAQRP